MPLWNDTTCVFSGRGGEEEEEEDDEEVEVVLLLSDRVQFSNVSFTPAMFSTFDVVWPS